MKRYPLHTYHRLARLLQQLRLVKSGEEIALLRQACAITRAGFERVARFVKPGVYEHEVEAEFSHEFLRRRGQFAYTPIIASGRNACVLHYIANDQPCQAGDLLLLDVAASHANYNSDLTRTIPVSGKFTPRQKQVYNAVLRVLRSQTAGLVPGKKWRDWQKEAEQALEKELVDLGLLRLREIKRQPPEKPAFRKYFMHGVGHPIGLDVHDIGLLTEPFAAGWVVTVEPGIYIPEENFAVRLENDILITEKGPVDLMADIPIETDEIEKLMRG
jgi:Xaa-Pro aminopeptidase